MTAGVPEQDSATGKPEMHGTSPHVRTTQKKPYSKQSSQLQNARQADSQQLQEMVPA